MNCDLDDFTPTMCECNDKSNMNNCDKCEYCTNAFFNQIPDNDSSDDGDVPELVDRSQISYYDDVPDRDCSDDKTFSRLIADAKEEYTRHKYEEDCLMCQDCCEPKEEPKEEPNEEPKDEPKVEPNEEPKEEPNDEPNDEPKEDESAPVETVPEPLSIIVPESDVNTDSQASARFSSVVLSDVAEPKESPTKPIVQPECHGRWCTVM